MVCCLFVDILPACMVLWAFSVFPGTSVDGVWWKVTYAGPWGALTAPVGSASTSQPPPLPSHVELPANHSHQANERELSGMRWTTASHQLPLQVVCIFLSQVPMFPLDTWLQVWRMGGLCVCLSLQGWASPLVAFFRSISCSLCDLSGIFSF